MTGKFATYGRLKQKVSMFVNPKSSQGIQSYGNNFNQNFIPLHGYTIIISSSIVHSLVLIQLLHMCIWKGSHAYLQAHVIDTSRLITLSLCALSTISHVIHLLPRPLSFLLTCSVSTLSHFYIFYLSG